MRYRTGTDDGFPAVFGDNGDVVIVVAGGSLLADRVCLLLNADQPKGLETASADLSPEEMDRFRDAFRKALAGSFTSEDAKRTAAREVGFMPTDTPL